MADHERTTDDSTGRTVRFVETQQECTISGPRVRLIRV
jgi:hypothetical protein